MTSHTGAAFAPSDLPPQASAFAAKYQAVLRSLPPVLAASLLAQVRHYDWMFPAESRELEEQFRYLSKSPTAETQRMLSAFQALPVPATTAGAWTNPESFLQAFTAHLWQVHATEQFRQCGEAYGAILAEIRTADTPSADRLAIVLIGQGARNGNALRFAKLRQHGTYFPHVDTADIVTNSIAVLEKRSANSQEPYRHWWIDGGSTAQVPAGSVAQVSYADLLPVRHALAERVRALTRQNDVGPEAVRSYMMSLQPSDLHGFPSHLDAVMRHFAVRMVCDGSGTQTLSTSFVQWSAREALRRARPATMVVRFAPRARNVDFIDASTEPGDLDAEGALVDADMGAYYTWLNLRRLQSNDQSRFVAIAENGQGAVAIGPAMSAGSTANKPATLRQIVDWMNG